MPPVAAVTKEALTPLRESLQSVEAVKLVLSSSDWKSLKNNKSSLMLLELPSIIKACLLLHKVTSLCYENIINY